MKQPNETELHALLDHLEQGIQRVRLTTTAVDPDGVYVVLAGPRAGVLKVRPETLGTASYVVLALPWDDAANRLDALEEWEAAQLVRESDGLAPGHFHCLLITTTWLSVVELEDSDAERPS
jgi:hypothetical protein